MACLPARKLNFGKDLLRNLYLSYRYTTSSWISRYKNSQRYFGYSGYPKRNYQTSCCLRGRDFFSDASELTRIEEEAKKCSFPVNYFEFTACQELYEALAMDGENRPLSGLKFNVAYIDTQPEAKKSVPVVVCLHGAPGGHWDFNNLINYLDMNGIRVIAPNFPGYDWTKIDDDYEFRNTPEEQAIFLKEFLEAIGVTKVDMGIAHSGSVYAAILLCSDELNVFQSMACINPAGLNYHRVLRPYIYMQFHSTFYRYRLLRPFLFLLLKFVLTIMDFGTRNVYHMSVALDLLSKVPYEKYRLYATTLPIRHFPLILIQSLADGVVEPKLSQDLAQVLGSTNDTVNKYDKDGNCSQKCKLVDSAVHQHLFEKGGHFLMKRYPDRVNEIVFEFFKKVQKSKNLSST